MKFLNILTAFAFIFFIGCGGGSDDQQQAESPMEQDQETQQAQETTDDVRTIDVIGVDQMQFVVENDAEGITLGEEIGSDGLQRLEGITAEPGEEIRIVLTTRSDLPASAMAHNWLLLTMDADVQTFANTAAKAKDNDYVPSDMEDQVVAQTGLAAGGETIEVTFTAPEESGEYEFICTFPGHFSAGMRGVFTVEESS